MKNVFLSPNMSVTRSITSSGVIYCLNVNGKKQWVIPNKRGESIMTEYNELREGQEFYGNGYKQGYADAELKYNKGEKIMTLEQTLEILNKYYGTEMTDEQYYNYHCAQNKITRLILGGEYELVKKGTEGDARPSLNDASTVDINTELSVAYLKGRRQGQSEERPQGEWKMIGNIGLAYTCDKCGEPNVLPTNFCPNCGAQMQKGGAE